MFTHVTQSERHYNRLEYICSRSNIHQLVHSTLNIAVNVALFMVGLTGSSDKIALIRRRV